MFSETHFCFYPHAYIILIVVIKLYTQNVVLLFHFLTWHFIEDFFSYVATQPLCSFPGKSEIQI